MMFFFFFLVLIRSFFPLDSQFTGFVGDFCSGSGTVALACALEGKSSISLDIDPNQALARRKKLWDLSSHLQQKIRDACRAKRDEAAQKILFAAQKPIYQIINAR